MMINNAKSYGGLPWKRRSVSVDMSSKQTMPTTKAASPLKSDLKMLSKANSPYNSPLQSDFKRSRKVSFGMVGDSAVCHLYEALVRDHLDQW